MPCILINQLIIIIILKVYSHAPIGKPAKRIPNRKSRSELTVCISDHMHSQMKHTGSK